MMTRKGFTACHRKLERYYNGGFVGLTIENIGFLELWSLILNTAAEAGLELKVFMTGSREHPFYASDQDALNVAAMYFEGKLYDASRQLDYEAVAPELRQGGAAGQNAPSGGPLVFRTRFRANPSVLYRMDTTAKAGNHDCLIHCEVLPKAILI
jgi:hypothetical protein